jgi:hypothetical protein
MIWIYISYQRYIIIKKGTEQTQVFTRYIPDISCRTAGARKHGNRDSVHSDSFYAKAAKLSSFAGDQGRFKASDCSLHGSISSSGAILQGIRHKGHQRL